MSKKTLEVKLTEAETLAKRKDERVLVAKNEAKSAWITVAEIKKMIEDVQQKQLVKKLAMSGFDIKTVCDFIEVNKEAIRDFSCGNITVTDKDINVKNKLHEQKNTIERGASYNPICDTCGAEMYLKEWNGKKFWACPNWQKGDNGHKTKPYR